MSTINITPEGASPVVATPAASPALSAADIANLSSDPVAFEKALMESNADPAALDTMLAGAAPKSKESYAGSVPEAGGKSAAPVAMPAAPAADPAAAIPPAADPAAPTATDDEPQPEKLGKFRVSARDFKEAEFLRLAKSMPVPEAYAKAYGTPQTAAEPAKSAAQPEAAPAPVADAPELTAAKSALTALETQLAKAQEDADLGAVTKLMREIGKAERAVERIESEAAASARAAQQSKADEATNNFRQREATVIKEVYSVFPKLGDKASAEHAEFQSFINLKFDDPDYQAIFTSPRWPKVLANEFAEAKGWGKATVPAAPAGNPAPVPGAPAAPRVTAAEVLTPGSTQGGASVITAETFVQDIGKMSPADLDKLLAAVG